MTLSRATGSGLTGKSSVRSLAAASGYPLRQAFDLIETITVGSGGAASVTFSNIPQTYRHLQVRGIAQSTTNALDYWITTLVFRINGDTGTNYAYHRIRRDGTSLTMTGVTGQNSIAASPVPSIYYANTYGPVFIDIMDYTAAKNKTVHTTGGSKISGDGMLLYGAGLWLNTAAVTSLTLLQGTGNLNQHSTFSLYGVA